MAAPDIDQRLRDIQGEYLDFLDDEVLLKYEPYLFTFKVL